MRNEVDPTVAEEAPELLSNGGNTTHMSGPQLAAASLKSDEAECRMLDAAQNAWRMPSKTVKSDKRGRK